MKIGTLVILGMLLLTGCDSPKTEIAKVDNEGQVKVGNDGQLISIQSDNVAAAGYSEKSGVMTVRFLNGATYEYYNVPIELWESFLEAQPHPWSEVGYPRLVGERFSYRRIN